MRSSSVVRALFIFYCAEIGAFLIMAPWSSIWDRTILQLPLPVIHTLYLQSWFRGAISGLGAIHLLWGAHDLEEWLSSRQAKR